MERLYAHPVLPVTQEDIEVFFFFDEGPELYMKPYLTLYYTMLLSATVNGIPLQFNLLKKKRNVLYMRNQSVPRCKHFPPRL